MSGTDHHHHHHPHNNFRREPFFENPSVQVPICFNSEDPLGYPRNNCFGPAKTAPGGGTHRRS
jgi:hypothetical protein